jgi:hypothetical protein
MTNMELELIERLIVEAAKRGAVELERERAVKAGEEAAMALETVRMEFLEAREFNTDLRIKLEEESKALRKSERNEETAIIALGRLVDAVQGPLFQKRRPRGLSPEMQNVRAALANAKARIGEHIPF